MKRNYVFAVVLFLTACAPAAPTQAPPAPTSGGVAQPPPTVAPAATAVSAAATVVSAAATVAPTVAAAAKPAATAIAAAAPTVAAVAGTAVANASSGSTLNIYLYQKPKNWNPLAPPNGPDTQVMTLIDDALLLVNDRYQYEPRLAEQWSVSPDARTFTFNLRRGLKWSDGHAFSARDVLFTYKLLANPASGSAQSAKFDHVVGIADYRSGKNTDVTGFRAPDDNTFVVELDQPNAAFISSISWPFYAILPEHTLGSADMKTLTDHPFFKNPTVGIGPYRFVRYETDQFVALEKNRN